MGAAKVAENRWWELQHAAACDRAIHCTAMHNYGLWLGLLISSSPFEV